MYIQKLFLQIDGDPDVIPDEYYAVCGWNKDGKPTEAKLKKPGILEKAAGCGVNPSYIPLLRKGGQYFMQWVVFP